MSSKNITPSLLILRYLDQSLPIVDELLMLAALCGAATDDEAVDSITLQYIGNTIKNIADKQRVLRHHYFKAPVRGIYEPFLKGELVRLKTEDSRSSDSPQRKKK